jgi:hypothetical protein
MYLQLSKINNTRRNLDNFTQISLFYIIFWSVLISPLIDQTFVLMNQFQDSHNLK